VAIYVQEILTDAAIAIRISNSSRESRSVSPDERRRIRAGSPQKSGNERREQRCGKWRFVSRNQVTVALIVYRGNRVATRKRNLAASFLASESPFLQQSRRAAIANSGKNISIFRFSDSLGSCYIDTFAWICIPRVAKQIPR